MIYVGRLFFSVVQMQILNFCDTLLQLITAWLVILKEQIEYPLTITEFASYKNCHTATCFSRDLKLLGIDNSYKVRSSHHTTPPGPPTDLKCLATLYAKKSWHVASPSLISPAYSSTTPIAYMQLLALILYLAYQTVNQRNAAI